MGFSPSSLQFSQLQQIVSFQVKTVFSSGEISTPKSATLSSSLLISPYPTSTYTFYQLLMSLSKGTKKERERETLGHFIFCALNKKKKYFSLRYTAISLPQKDPKDKGRTQKISCGWATGRGRSPSTYVEMFLSQREDFISS